MGHYTDHYHDTDREHNEQIKLDILQEISEELEDERSYDELKLILEVIRASESFLTVADIFKKR